MARSDTLVCILPHHDDEFFLIPLILSREQNNFKFFRFIFLTFDTQIRLDEYLKFEKLLSKFAEVESIQIGKELKVAPRELYKNVNTTHTILYELMMNSIQNKEEVAFLFPNLEFGHADHDAAFVIGMKLCQEFKLNAIVYNSYRVLNRAIPKFIIMKTLKPQVIKASARTRLGSVLLLIRGFIIYQTQIKTWLKIGPIVLLKFIFSCGRNLKLITGEEIEKYVYNLHPTKNQESHVRKPYWLTRNYFEIEMLKIKD
jgi:hypothetical protein